MENVMNTGDCKRCGTKLTRDEERNCLFCGQCHPLSNKSVPMEELEKNYIDIIPNKKRKEEIIKIIKDIVPDLILQELENWHIKKPVETETLIKDNPDEPVNWKSEAKELNIELYDKKTNRPRKKVDVLLDIEKQKISK